MSDPIVGEVWQEADGCLVVCAKRQNGEIWWYAFYRNSLVPDNEIAYPIRRVLDTEAKFVPEVVSYLED